MVQTGILTYDGTITVTRVIFLFIDFISLDTRFKNVMLNGVVIFARFNFVLFLKKNFFLRVVHFMGYYLVCVIYYEPEFTSDFTQYILK